MSVAALMDRASRNRVVTREQAHVGVALGDRDGGANGTCDHPTRSRRSGDKLKCGQHQREAADGRKHGRRREIQRSRDLHARELPRDRLPAGAHGGEEALAVDEAIRPFPSNGHGLAAHRSVFVPI